MRRSRRRLAARYLRALSTLENLVVLGQYAEARRFVESLDPLEARSLAGELEDDRIGASRGTGVQLRLAPRNRVPW